MPPKTAAKDGAADSSDMSDVAVLCHMLMSATEIKVDGSVMGPMLGLSASHKGNVVRNINTRIKPHGFEFKFGKVFPIGKEPPASPDHGEDKAAPSTPAGKANNKSAKGSKTPASKTPASKKRKVAGSAPVALMVVKDEEEQQHLQEEEKLMVAPKVKNEEDEDYKEEGTCKMEN